MIDLSYRAALTSNFLREFKKLPADVKERITRAVFLNVFCVQLGSVLGIFNPSKCLSKDTMASAFVDRAEAYWMASSMSRFVSPVSSIALISSAMLVGCMCSSL